jgi:hypothetical protein
MHLEREGIFLEDTTWYAEVSFEIPDNFIVHYSCLQLLPKRDSACAGASAFAWNHL